jgi:hypothetical protein
VQPGELFGEEVNEGGGMPISAVMHKVDRAKVHLDALTEAVEAWKKSQSTSFSDYDNLERGEYVVELRPPNVDIRTALIAGDFICCLRSSLDHLAWQLAATGSGNPNKVSFPMIGVDNPDNQRLFIKSTIGIPEEALVTIRSLQPYQVGDKYKRKYLWILHTLWNIDKHRHIPMHSAVTQFNLDAASAKPVNLDKFDDHMKLAFNLSDKAGVKFLPMSKPEVYFGDEKEEVMVTVDNLRTIYEAIRTEVIPAFAGFFV